MDTEEIVTRRSVARGAAAAGLVGATPVLDGAAWRSLPVDPTIDPKPASHAVHQGLKHAISRLPSFDAPRHVVHTRLPQ